MDTEWLPPIPSPEPEARIQVELTERELVALINRLVPHNTWMKRQSNRVVRETFEGGVPEAQELADQLTNQLIRAHDDRTDPRWVQRR